MVVDLDDLDELTLDDHPKVTRGSDSYATTNRVVRKQVGDLLELHRRSMSAADSSQAAPQECRLIRDFIDRWLRRYHQYAIRENKKARHYVQDDIELRNACFDHVLPMACVTHLLLKGALSVEQAMNSPTCYISKENDKFLRENGLAKKTPSRVRFFERYEILKCRVVFWNNKAEVDIKNWTLKDHFRHFGVAPTD